MPSKTLARPTSAKAGGAASKRSTGGNGLTNDLAKLSIPFGIVLAQNGLRNYLDSQKRSTSAKPKAKTTTKPKTKGGAPLEGAPLVEGGKRKKASKK